jgi:4-alpha-glucanotransferase
MRGTLFVGLEDRQAGVLLHPTALANDQGIGTFGAETIEWLDFLAAAGVGLWQVCPLGPTGYGDSPYQCFSSFAGNPYLIDLEPLVAGAWLARSDLAGLAALPMERVDFGALYTTKWPVLFKAQAAAKAKKYRNLPYGDFEEFRTRHEAWLAPYGLFLALKDHYAGKPWWDWPVEHRFFTASRRATLPSSVLARAEAHEFFQYLFFGQWALVKEAARARGIALVGDAPIFVARDSADVWSRPDLFQVDQTSGLPTVVAGVPPDYFSEEGQLWGNPLYAWEAHEAENFAWWIRRLRANFELCDFVRIDHFRAFHDYWAIPAEARTAKSGVWQEGPGLKFFEAVRAEMPEAKLIAEDLGDLSPGVHALRTACGLPGMSILQFAFGGEDASNLYLPHNHAANSVVYPGTHDNTTALGWYRSATAREQDHVRRYLRIDGREIGWDLIRCAYSSVSRLAIIPMQDILNLGDEARFNTPGVAAGNWQWRLSGTALRTVLEDGTARYLRTLAALYGRSPRA